jgi:hypothetical protein
VGAAGQLGTRPKTRLPGGLDIKIYYLIVVLYSVPLVFGGVRTWLDKFNGFLLPFYLVGTAAAIVWATVEYDAPAGWLSAPGSATGFHAAARSEAWSTAG